MQKHCKSTFWREGGYTQGLHTKKCEIREQKYASRSTRHDQNLQLLIWLAIRGCPHSTEWVCKSGCSRTSGGGQAVSQWDSFVRICIEMSLFVCPNDRLCSPIFSSLWLFFCRYPLRESTLICVANSSFPLGQIIGSPCTLLCGKKYSHKRSQFKERPLFNVKSLAWFSCTFSRVVYTYLVVNNVSSAIFMSCRVCMIFFHHSVKDSYIASAQLNCV